MPPLIFRLTTRLPNRLPPKEVLYPFSHGLSYTSFHYADLTVSGSDITTTGTVTAQFTLHNDGVVAGKEGVQLYIRPLAPGLRRPPRELKAFTKIALAQGEAKVVSFTLSARDFQYFDPTEQRFVLRADAFVIEISASSCDIRLWAEAACAPELPPRPKLSTSLAPGNAYAHPDAMPALVSLVGERLKLETSEATALLERIRDSFFGIYDALSWYIGDILPESKLQAHFDALNQR